MWRDVLGIILITALALWAIKALKGTRTIQMLGGVGVVLAAIWAGEWLELFPARWAVTQHWPELVLIVFIVFQPELRRALAQIGRSPFRRSNGREETRVVEEIVKAATALAHRRLGAILVLERDQELLDLVEVGTVVDARISKELLISIFLPYSPLHDGAVILRGQRVAAAGCFLPLSTRDRSVEAYGTRHRAALGITEETDAAAIVVSEETGTVAFMVGGEMHRDLDTAALRTHLLNVTVPPAPARKIGLARSS